MFNVVSTASYGNTLDTSRIKEEWEIKPLPTLLGNIDARRFYTFAQGQGSMASNCMYEDRHGSVDTIGKTILHPIKVLPSLRKYTLSEASQPDIDI